MDLDDMLRDIVAWGLCLALILVLVLFLFDASKDIKAHYYCKDAGYDKTNNDNTYCLSCTKNIVGVETCEEVYKIPMSKL